MGNGRLTYDGTTYVLDSRAVPDLVARGVIVPDGRNENQFELSPAHLVEELEPFAAFAGFESGDAARGETERDGKRRLFSMSFQYHRDGQGGR